MSLTIKPLFEWRGKKKQVCRVNGVIVGFVEGWSYRGKVESYRWDTRFSNCHKPHFNTIEEARDKIEEIFLSWLKGIV